MASDDITLTRLDDIEQDGQAFAVYVDGDGEILEVPLAFEGGRLAYAVAQFEEAKQQANGWAAAKARWQALIIDEQGEKKASYGDVVVSIRQNPITEFDRDRFAERFIGEFLPREMQDAEHIVAVLHAVTGLDAEMLKAAELPDWAAIAKRLPTGRYTRPWVESRKVLRDFRS